ncbi:MAG: NACHT domain-containing protein, partial [Nitrospirae bacterium]
MTPNDAPAHDDVPSPILEGAAAPPFVGRDAEVAALANALARERRVTVTGEAGIGKSALVEALLEHLEVEEGLSQVRLSFHGHPSPAVLVDRLERYLARSPEAPRELSRREWGERDPLERLADLPRLLEAEGHRRLLLVLENLEALEDPAGDYRPEEQQALATFLQGLAATPVRLLATSRTLPESLLGSQAAAFPVEGVAEAGRAELLRSYCAHFESLRGLEAGSPAARAKLLELLGGHPLASRMAAFCLGHLDLADVVQGLGERLSAVEQAGAPMPSRRLAAAFGLALDTLPASRRAALLILGALRGSFWERSYLGLLQGDAFPSDVIADRSDETLEATVRHAGELGVVRPDRERPFVLHPQPAAHDTLIALWPVAHEGDLLRALEVYVCRYWSSAAEALRTEGLPNQERIPQILAFCGVEEANLRHALRLAEAHTLWDEARPILFILLNVWQRQKRDHDATRLRRHWLGLVSFSQEDPAPRHPDNLKAMELWRFLWGHEANFRLAQGQYEEAEQIHLRVAREEEGREEPDEVVLGGIYFRIARTYEERKIWDRARAWQEKSLRVRTRITDPHGMAACHHHLGLIALGEGDAEAALKHFEEAIQLRERAEDVHGASDSYLQAARAQQRLGRLDEAHESLRQALEGYEMRQERPLIAATCQQLCSVHAARGDLEAAEKAARRSLEIRTQLGDVEGMAANQGQLARLAEQRGDATAAVEAAVQAMALLRRVDSPRVGLAAQELRRLRQSLGPDRFDAAWRSLG